MHNQLYNSSLFSCMLRGIIIKLKGDGILLPLFWIEEVSMVALVKNKALVF